MPVDLGILKLTSFIQHVTVSSVEHFLGTYTFASDGNQLRTERESSFLTLKRVVGRTISPQAPFSSRSGAFDCQLLFPRCDSPSVRPADALLSVSMAADLLEVNQWHGK